jgi:hypothetical protein
MSIEAEHLDGHEYQELNNGIDSSVIATSKVIVIA